MQGSGYLPHGKNSPQEKFWNFVLAWNTLKLPLKREDCEVSSAFFVPKNAFLSSELLFYFAKLPFYFPEVLFCFLELSFRFPEVPFCFPEVLSYIAIMPCYFPELSISFPELPSFCLLCASFSKDGFFPSWLYLLLGLIMAFQRDNICLVLVLCPLGTIYWPTNDALHLACVHMEYDFFMYFINF